MIQTLLLTVIPATAAPAALPASPVFPDARQDAGDHVAEIEAAGEDVPKLLELAEGYAAAGKDDAAKAAYRRVVELDGGNAQARKALGHHEYDGKWFESYAELSKYRRAEAKRMLEEHGMVRLDDEWVPQADVPFLRMGWIREGGLWMHPADAAKLAEEQKLKEAGWQQQDLTWVHPDEFDKWKAGLFKVGDEWLTKEAANAVHSSLDDMWEVPGERFIAVTTVDRDSAGWVYWWADQTYADLVRIFGKKPSTKPRVIAVNSRDQYNVFAGGDPGTNRPPAEATGYSSVHYAFFADALVDTESQPPRYLGTGACYWAPHDENLKNYGVHAVRHAAAQSYIEAIDPSWDYISSLVSGGGGAFSVADFWAEKKIPLWLRYGAASYVERYFKDPNVDATGNPWWARDWAFENLRQQGGPRPFADIFAFQLDPTDPAGGGKLISEAGLVVSFVLDGNCQPVVDAHQAFKAALKTGEGVAEAVTALQGAIVANERAFKMYSNM